MLRTASIRLARRAGVLVIGVMFAASVQAQSNLEISNCEEVKDEATATQAEICSAHVGCKFVLGIQKGCAKAKSFLNNLGNIISRNGAGATPEDDGQKSPSIFDKVRSALGLKPKVTSNDVFDASLSDGVRSIGETDKVWKERAQPIRNAIDKADTKELTGTNANGTKFAYIGDVKEGKATGWGTAYFSNGETVRGQFEDGSRVGQGDVQFTSGARALGTWNRAGKLTGEVLEVNPNLYQYRGNFQAGQRNGEGTLYRPDGSVFEKGIFSDGELSVGERYDEQGKVIAEINRPRDAELAKEAAQKAAIEAAQREAEERRIAEVNRRAEEDRLAAAKAEEERRFQQSLAKNNAGELFALADKLGSEGQSEKSREVLRTLLSRFPDHPLAATAARQMTAAAGPKAAPESRAISQGKPTSRYPSVCERNLDKVDKVTLASGLRSQSATYDLFVRDINLYTAKVLETCINASATAARRYKRDMDQYNVVVNYCSGPHQNWECRPWGSEPEMNQAFYRLWKAEIDKALADPNYSADLGAAAASVAGPERSTNLAICKAEEDRSILAKQIRQISPNDTSRLLRGAIAGADELIAIYSKCLPDPQAKRVIDEAKASRESAVRTCRQISNPDTCLVSPFK